MLMLICEVEVHIFCLETAQKKGSNALTHSDHPAAATERTVTLDA